MVGYRETVSRLLQGVCQVSSTKKLHRFEIPEGVLHLRIVQIDCDEPMILGSWLNGIAIELTRAERLWHLHRLHRRYGQEPDRLGEPST